MQNNKNTMKNRKKYLYALTVGFFGGLIWGTVFFLVYYLQFTNIGTSIYAKSILNPEYLMKWQGHLIGVLFFILFSIIVSFIYAFFFTRFKGPIPGIIYGIVLWGLVFILMNRFFHLTKPVSQLGFNDNTVMITLYILTGLFIGYSLSAEFNSEDKDNKG